MCASLEGVIDRLSEDLKSDHLVLIPGLLCTAALYGAQMADLSRGATVCVGDHRGHDTLGALASSILADAPEHFALAGLSMGGYLAFEIIRQAPHRVERLALLDTSARPDSAEQSENRHRLVTLARKKGLAVPVREMFPKLVAPSRSDDELLKALVLEMAEATGVAGFARQQAAIAGRPDSRQMLCAIACPTLVVVGEEDQLTPPEFATEMANAIVGSQLVVVPGAGHLSTLEAPQMLTDALVSWLRA